MDVLLSTKGKMKKASYGQYLLEWKQFFSKRAVEMSSGFVSATAMAIFG